MTGPSWQNIQLMGLDESFTDYEHDKNEDSEGKPAKKEKVTYINSLDEHNAAMERLNSKRR